MDSLESWKTKTDCVRIKRISHQNQATCQETFFCSSQINIASQPASEVIFFKTSCFEIQKHLRTSIKIKKYSLLLFKTLNAYNLTCDHNLSLFLSVVDGTE